ncbi:MAG: acylphosphatase [Desulfobacterales bacterium]|nr:acylphosphatase [Desulfobacterales bacterium]
MERKVRAHVIIHGRVQGVFFRLETQKAARQFGVTGWVRNLSDGNVEAVMEGSAAAVDALFDWCGRGPRLARVDKVDIIRASYVGEYDSFEVTY